MLKRIEAVAGIVWADGRYLMAERPQGTIMAGYWEFPGGKLEAGETPAQALLRELEEELGIQCLQTDFFQTLTHEYRHGHVTLHLFSVPRFAGKPMGLEGQALHWIEPANPPDLLYLPVNSTVVELLRGGFGRSE